MFGKAENQTGESQEEQNLSQSQDSESLEERMEKLNNSGKRSGKIIGIIILLIFLGGIVAGGYYFRDDIVNFFNSKKQTDLDIQKPVYKCSDEHPEACDKNCQVDSDCYPACTYGCGCLRTGEICSDKDNIKCEIAPFSCKCENNTCEIVEYKEIYDATKSQIDTSNWQTYRNEEYGFMVKYPDEWEIAWEIIKENNDNTYAHSFFAVAFKGIKNAEIEETQFFINIRVIDKTEEEYFKHLADIKKESAKSVKIFKVNDISWTIINQLDISISARTYGDNVQCQFTTGLEHEDILKAMVSTFKLLQDTDNDGLSDDNEAKYGCDLNNPDTDGDGYLDGDEVKNGYNPNGEGKL